MEAELTDAEIKAALAAELADHSGGKTVPHYVITKYDRATATAATRKALWWAVGVLFDETIEYPESTLLFEVGPLTAWLERVGIVPWEAPDA